MNNIEKTDFENCHTRWGKHPSWTISLKHLNGEITQVNGDGTYEVKFHHPCDYGMDMMRTATMTLECTTWGFTDSFKESQIEWGRRNLKVGDKVLINQYKNLFYIYIWERKFRYGEYKMVFRRGEPHAGYKTLYKIDVV